MYYQVTLPTGEILKCLCYSDDDQIINTEDMRLKPKTFTQDQMVIVKTFKKIEVNSLKNFIELINFDDIFINIHTIKPAEKSGLQQFNITLKEYFRNNDINIYAFERFCNNAIGKFVDEKTMSFLDLKELVKDEI